MKKLIDYMPSYYRLIEEIIELQRVVELEYLTLIEKVNDIFKQTNIYTATWGLKIWEKILNLHVGDEFSNFETRREKIILKLRGTGTTTHSKIKSLALSITTGEIEIIEDSKNYSFTIKFTSIVGKAPNLKIFKEAIEEVKPAHLGYKIEFRYNTHGELNKHKLTHEQLAQYTHKQIYDTRIFQD